MKPAQKGHFPRVIDSTIRADFVSCSTKGYWSFIRQLGPPFPSVDLVAGGAFARGLEVTRLLFFGEKQELPDALHAGMLAAVEAYGDIEVPERKEKKGVDRVIHALGAYFEKYPPATDYIQPMYTADGKPMVEFTFSIPLPINHPETEEPLLYAGRFDLVGLYHDQIFGVDEKTTSQLGPSWAAKWNLRGQFTGYTWAMQQYGKPAVGVIVRGVSFLKDRFGFEESIQPRPQWMIDQWYEQLLYDVRRMIESWETSWYDQDFNDSCADYGGCPFMRLCSSADPENWIAGHYAPREWDPLRKVPYVQPKPQVESIALPEGLKELIGARP